MADRLAHARGWFLKGESDLSAARRILDGEGPYDTACFHFEFWPTRDTAQEALDLALEVRRRTLAAVPPEAKP
jgi:HEPN domain-containing protein